MPPPKREAIYIILPTISLYLLILVLFLMTPFPFYDTFNFIIRFAALFGFTSTFVATIMSPFAVQLYKVFGKPFVKIHHIFSITGIAFLTLHPITLAISVVDFTILLPDFTSWSVFWTYGGRIALPLIYLAVFGALLRKKIIKIWRIIHSLNYLALFLAYVHGVLIGEDLQSIGFLIIFTIMIILSYAVLIYKRYLGYKRRKKLSLNKNHIR